MEQWKSHERHFLLIDSTFTKRELRQDELPINRYSGQPVAPRWSRQRLRNEVATLKLIATETSIPVSQFVRLYECEGLCHLTACL